MGLKLAVTLTAQLESELQVTFAVSHFRQLSLGLGKINYLKCRAWYEAWGIIQLPKCKGTLFREFLYHELGHALLAEYNISKNLLTPFTTRQSKLFKYFNDVNDNSEGPRPDGFVTKYAGINRSEDFCETFSAWVLNDFKTSGKILYNGDLIDLSKDSKLKKKFEAVAEILNACSIAEDQSA